MRRMRKNSKPAALRAGIAAVLGMAIVMTGLTVTARLGVGVGSSVRGAPGVGRDIGRPRGGRRPSSHCRRQISRPPSRTCT